MTHDASNRPLTEGLQKLMLRYQSGESAAADELIGLANPILVRYLYATSGSSLHLDDLLQECWLRIHKARGSYRPGDPVLPWMMAIARHTRVDQYRKWQRTHGREVEYLGSATSHPAATVPDTLRPDAIRNAIHSLPDSQREVVVMLKLTGMTAQEVALATESTVGAVKQKAYRAYQTIRQTLGSESSQASNKGAR